MSKTVVYYHKNCLDGFISGLVAARYFGFEDVIYKALDYKDVKIDDLSAIEECFEADLTYVLDFSFKKDVLEIISSKLKGDMIILDHHESVFKDFGLEFITQTYDAYPNVYLILNNNNKSGAILAYDYFNPPLLKLDEPYDPAYYPRACKLADDGDRWIFKFTTETRAFRAAMQGAMFKWTISSYWIDILDDNSILFKTVIDAGKTLDEAHMSNVYIIAKNAKHTKFADWNVNICNANKVYSSDLGNFLAAYHIGDNPLPDFSMVWFYVDKLDMVEVSLRSIGDFNVSNVAAQFGGGGHKNAAGFTIKLEEFMTLLNI